MEPEEMNPEERKFFERFFNEKFLSRSNVERNLIERKSGRIPSNLEFLRYESVIKLLKSLSDAKTASPDDLEKIRILFSYYGDEVINRSLLTYWLRALLFNHFNGDDNRRFLEILGEKVREEGGEESQREAADLMQQQQDFVHAQAEAAQQKRAERDQEEAAVFAQIAREAREARGGKKKYSTKKKYATKKRFSSRKIKSRHKHHRVFRAKVKNSRRNHKNKN